jgi:hypothetical protein
MYKMTGLRRQIEGIAAIAALSIALCGTQACGRQEPLQPGDTALATSRQELPFHPEQISAESGSEIESEAAAAQPTTVAPFHSASHPGVLPSGTLLTVRLEDSLSTTKFHAGDTFTASVASPFSMGGRIVVDRGAAVSGRVESAKSGGPAPDGIASPGYFQLTLTAMTVSGRQVPLQTSSLFTRGSSSPSARLNPDARVTKGRRLTFRLSAPATWSDGDSIATRKIAVAAGNSPSSN